MLSTYDIQALSRLEERLLDPDYNGSIWSEEKEEAEYNRADEEYAEKCYERRFNNG